MKRFCPNDLALPNVTGLSAYVPGVQPSESGWTKLNTNENPYPPSCRVANAIGKECERLRLYPDPTSKELRHALARYHGVNPSRVIVGNGSDDVLNLLFRTFSGADRPAGWTVPSYSLYPVLAGIQGCVPVLCEFDSDIRLPAAAIERCGANIFFLTSPNAPTGVAFPNREIDRLAGRFPGVLVIDEAYVDFARESAIALLDEHPNLVVARTFSKSYSLAGIRVGYAVASDAVVALLDRVRESYNVDRIAQAAARAALEDRTWCTETIGRILATRQRTLQRLAGLGWHTYPSEANFVFTRPVEATGRSGKSAAADLFEWLRAGRVLVRYFPCNPLTEAYLRVTIGTDSQMDRFFERVKSWPKNA